MSSLKISLNEGCKVLLSSLLLRFFKLWLFSGKVKHVSKVISKLNVVLFVVSLKGLSQVLFDRFLIKNNVILKNLEVLNWVGHGIESILKLVEIERRGVNGLTSWETLLDLLNSSDCGNDSSNCIRDFSFRIFILNDFLDLLNSNVEHEEGLVLFANADKKSI